MAVNDLGPVAGYSQTQALEVRPVGGAILAEFVDRRASCPVECRGLHPCRKPLQNSLPRLNYMYVDRLHFCIALCPLAVYCLLLGVLNLSKRPILTSGGRDLAALGLAICGLVVIGPMELFLPEPAAVLFGGYVWLLLLGLYAMLICLLVLVMRPRLVIYNITSEQLRPILATTVAELDREVRWAGECLVLPQLGVQLHLDAFVGMRNVQLVSAGPNQSFQGWRRLETALTPALRQLKTTRNPYGITLLLFGLLMVAMITHSAVHDSQAIRHALFEMLRL